MKDIITSKGSNLFSGTQLLLMFFGLSGVAFVSGISELKYFSLLVWVLVFLKRKLQVNVSNKSFKDGLFHSWEVLSDDGYISIFQKVNERSKEMDEDSLKLLWVSDSETKHIYSPQDLDDAKSVAFLLADKWTCKVYQSHGKVWLRD